MPSNIITNFENKDCLNMDPIELVNFLESELKFEIPHDVVGKKNQEIAAATITKATAYASFFTEMETRAKILKKNAKANKNTEDYNKYMSIEDIFKSFKEVAKMQIENVAKLMTLRRLELEDQKQNYNYNIT